MRCGRVPTAWPAWSALYFPQEAAHLGSEALCRLDVAHMPDSGHHHQARRWDLGVEILSHTQRGTYILVAVQQQGRHVDAWKHIAEILIGERVKEHLLSGRMELGQERHDLVDQLRRCRFREHGRAPLACPLLGWQVECPQDVLEALFDYLGWQGAGPPGIDRSQDQGPRDRGMPTVEIQRELAAEGQPEHVRSLQAERLDERGEAVDVVGRAEPLGRIR